MSDSRNKRMILYSVLFAVSAVFYLFWYCMMELLLHQMHSHILI